MWTQLIIYLIGAAVLAASMILLFKYRGDKKILIEVSFVLLLLLAMHVIRIGIPFFFRDNDAILFFYLIVAGLVYGFWIPTIIIFTMIEVTKIKKK
jgi:hypothetical protein